MLMRGPFAVNGPKGVIVILFAYFSYGPERYTFANLGAPADTLWMLWQIICDASVAFPAVRENGGAPFYVML